MWTWINGLIQDYTNNDIPAMWDGFITEFTQQFSDSQKEQRACIKLKEHRFKYPEINSYISKFEDLARLAGYTQGSPEATELFLKGLPVDILKEVMRSPRTATYAETKEHAIDAVRTKQTLEAITKKMASGNSPGFSSFHQGPTQCRPFYYQGNQNTGGWRNQPQQQFAPHALQVLRMDSA